jgi:hypothetical protein
LLPDQHRDGMLQDGALQGRVDLLSLARQQLGLRTDNVGFRRNTDAVAMFCNWSWARNSK